VKFPLPIAGRGGQTRREHMSVKTGLEMLLSKGAASLRGKTIGIVSNQASVGPGFAHVVDLLGVLPAVRIGALFGPEHGVRGEAQDMIAVKDGGAEGLTDRKLGVPVHSLYGELTRLAHAHAGHVRGPRQPSSSTCRTSAAATTRSTRR